ncbi:MAG: SET domain-containing protein-lysine N-methyltransferase [Phenylobacterium sp.]|uniref:SET domain-containing protein n=1 Tax=Phenylobacterium sp. TaxID=1871053 RepID=UPI001A46A841|nr:SET domain-containing protein-lysine N-methyltransferase [Phenylobacterium sp.]MBL8555194.1 SET domain-containing protein-lysine N-methyltransferase [Phenylobacterium sp.]
MKTRKVAGEIAGGRVARLASVGASWHAATMSDGVEVRSAPAGGQGLFAARPFAAGATIRRIGLVREVTAERPLTAGETADHVCRIDGRSWLVGAPDRYVNHACEPSAWKRFDPDGGPEADMVALVDIPAGGEITYDYVLNTHGGGRWACGCGAATCRGMLEASWFDLSEATRRRQRPLLATWFVRRHAARLAQEGMA